MAFIKKHCIFLIYISFSMFFCWTIFQSIKTVQIFSNVDFSAEDFERVASGESKVFDLKLKTDSLYALHIPFFADDDVCKEDFTINIQPDKIRTDVCIFRIDKKDNGESFFILKSPVPIQPTAIEIACKKNITYFYNNNCLQTKQYGLQNKAKCLFVFIYIILICLLYFFVFIINRLTKNFAPKYFFYSIMLGTACILIYPAFNISDERIHFNSAYYYANIITKVQSFDSKAKNVPDIMFRKCDNLIYPKEISDNSRFTREAIEVFKITELKKYYAFAFPKVLKAPNEREYVTLKKEVTDIKRVIYIIPHIIGIILFRFINANQYILYYGTCFLSLLWNSLILTFAFSKTKCKNILFYFLAFNPALLQTMCHFTYDGAIYSLALSFIILFISFYKNRQKSDFLLSVFCLILLYPAKSHVYTLLGFLYLILLPSPKKNLLKLKKLNKKFCYMIFIIILLIIFLLICKANNQVLYIPRRAYGRWDLKSFMLTKSFLLAKPFSSILLLLNTIGNHFFSYAGQSLGCILGVRNLFISFFLQIPYFTILYFALIDKSNFIIDKNLKKICLFVCCGIILAIFIGMGVSYAFSGTEINGVLGRYFIPVLPIFFMAFNFRQIFMKKTCDNSELLQVAIPLCSFLFFINVFEIIINNSFFG